MSKKAYNIKIVADNELVANEVAKELANTYSTSIVDVISVHKANDKDTMKKDIKEIVRDIFVLIIIKDIFAMAFIAAVLLSDVNNWWVLLGIIILIKNK